MEYIEISLQDEAGTLVIRILLEGLFHLYEK